MSSGAELLLEAQLAQAHIPFEREVRFDPRRRWRFDYTVCGVGVEIEGGTWSSGRHTRGEGYERDLEKYNAAALQGWTVLRFTTAMVEDGRALATIREAVT